MSKAECLILFAAGIFAFPPAARAGFINAVWTGGDSSSVWTDALNWSPSGIPNNGANTFSVSIASTAYNPVTLGTNTTINQLIMAATTSLSLSPSVTLNLVSGPSTLTNAQLTGGGSLVVGDTLQGSGYVAPSALTNNGSIIANIQSTPLFVAPVSLTNSGLMTATGGAALLLGNGNNIANTGGTISANGANSVVAVMNPSTTVTGGTVEAINGGEIQLDAATQGATLNAGANSNLTMIGAQVTGGAVNVNATGSLNLWTSPSSINSTLSNYGTISVDAATTVGGTMQNYSGGVINVNGSSLSLQAGGTYTNNGAINLNSAALELAGSGTVSLSGSGTLNMNGSGTGIISTAAGQTFDNGAGHTIQGGGLIYTSSSVTNSGLMTATGGAALQFQTGSITNTGLMTAIGGGGLTFETGNITNTGGTISANGANSVVGVMNTSTTTLTGGTVEAVNGGTLLFMGGAAQSATLNAGANSLLDLYGAQVTRGTVNIGATGTMVVEFYSNITSSTLSNYGTINVSSPATTTIGNAIQNYSGGVIDVASGSTLSLAAGGTYTNNGTFDVRGGKRPAHG